MKAPAQSYSIDMREHAGPYHGVFNTRMSRMQRKWENMDLSAPLSPQSEQERLRAQDDASRQELIDKLIRKLRPGQTANFVHSLSAVEKDPNLIQGANQQAMQLAKLSLEELRRLDDTPIQKVPRLNSFEHLQHNSEMFSQEHTQGRTPRATPRTSLAPLTIFENQEMKVPMAVPLDESDDESDEDDGDAEAGEDITRQYEGLAHPHNVAEKAEKDKLSEERRQSEERRRLVAIVSALVAVGGIAALKTQQTKNKQTHKQEKQHPMSRSWSIPYSY